MRHLIGAAMIGAVIAAFAVVGEMDAQDQARQDAHTCKMVEAGAWPAEVAEGINCEQPSRRCSKCGSKRVEEVK